MAWMKRLVGRINSALCRHEWVGSHKGGRLSLRCLYCGRTTSGVEVGSDRFDAGKRSRFSVTRRSSS
jgi:hypothetical protein